MQQKKLGIIRQFFKFKDFNNLKQKNGYFD